MSGQVFNKTILNDDSLGLFVNFLKNHPSEVVIKSYSCEQREDTIIQGKLFITKSFLFFVSLKDKGIKSIIPLLQIESIDLKNNALVVSTIKTISYKLYNFRRAERTATFVVNFWALSVRPRNYKLNVLKSICKNKSNNGFISSSSIAGRSEDSSCSSTGAGVDVSNIRGGYRQHDILHENKQVSSNSSYFHLNMDSLVTLSSSLMTPFSYLVNIASSLSQEDQRSTAQMVKRKQSIESKSLQREHQQEEKSYITLFGYFIVIILSLSTYFLHTKMSKLPQMLSRYANLQLDLANCAHSTNNKGLAIIPNSLSAIQSTLKDGP